VHAYTAGAAYAAGEERERGSISPGKLADLVVLSDDILEMDPERILETTVDLTFFDGRPVYER
jgi:predicted amidohydrolase YtcJ